MYESYLVLIPVLLTGICIFRFPNAPMGYVELDQHPESLANLSKLVWSTRLISLVQFILSALDLWFTKNLFMAAMALNWFILIWIATGLHRPSNVEQGSHLALFLVLIGNFISAGWLHIPMLPIIISKFLVRLDAQLFVASSLVNLVYILVIGFWSDRMEEEENVISC